MENKYDKYFEFAESIPMDELYQEIRKLTGLQDLKFTHKIVEDRFGKPYIKFESQDLVDKVGFLKLLFSRITVSTFNSSINYDEDRERMYWWGTVAFDYDHPSGGSNGHTFLSFWYTSSGWDFRVE